MTAWEKFKVVAWGIIKAVPQFMLKTKFGRTLLAIIVVAALKKVGINLPVDTVTEFLNQILGGTSLTPDMVSDGLLALAGSAVIGGGTHRHITTNGKV